MNREEKARNEEVKIEEAKNEEALKSLEPDAWAQEDDDLAALKAKRARKLSVVALLLVLAVATAAVAGVLSGGGFFRWFRGITKGSALVTIESPSPSWDLTAIFGDADEAEDVLNALLSEVNEALNQGRIPDEDSLDQMLRTAERLLVYATLIRDSDLGNARAKAFQTSVDALINKVTRLSYTPHSADEGPSIVELSGIYERIYQSFDHSYGAAFGEDPALFSEDVSRRYKAFEKWTRDQAAAAEVYADIYEGKVIFDNYLALMYGETEAADAFISQDRFSTAAFAQLSTMTHQNLALNHRWVALKAELLGMEGPLRFSDLFVGSFIGEEPLSVSEAEVFMNQALQPLPDTGREVVGRAFSEKWIDFYPREDKYEGAYTYGAYESHPYLLLNYTGTPDSLAELAHELGHAVHMTISAQNQPFDTYYADVTASEFAASVTELLFHEYCLAQAGNKEEKLTALAGYLDFLSATYFDQMMATEFEVEAHRMSLAGEDLSAASLRALWNELMTAYMGPDYEITELDGYDWVSYPHLYWDFYMYNYATGIVAAYPVASGLLRDDPKARDHWNRIMAAGGSLTGAELMAEAGFNYESEDLYKNFFERWTALMDELEFLLDAS
ncbi:M3 family oligoendopeptidase [Acidaminobacter hydrogenoformans]|uniref:Oligoendopeptidase F n=1 Tax=Acidaminobacter hydrogenoformans DSM 2784 TaxID=1120920 RepID=A0A1G5S7M5_9FIRM|nr:M3 family metallopeptidase [Acidaminobacter hydrogenoformans]SCZ81711.1 Oligoendopeptidase F [Acidaminobacter hydrogenoformans DSM 2784]